MSASQVASTTSTTPADVSSSAHSISKTVSLPGELTDFIIDHLHDDPKALQSCAMVCRLWTVRAYSHLWSLLHFRGEHGQSTPPIWRRLIEDIHDSPNIAHHVRRIEIHGVPSKSAQRVLNSLGRFPNLEALEIFAQLFPEGDWISQTISATLTTLLLREVFFHDADDMYLFICGFTNLCNLSIDNITGSPFLRLSPLPPPAECRILHLRRLKLTPILSLSSHMYRWLQGLNVDIHVDSLRIGELCPNPDVPHEALQEILPRVMGPSLKHFEIEIGPVITRGGVTGDIEDTVARIDMSQAVNLLTVIFETNAGFPVAIISRLIASTISRAPPSLQTFIFTISCYHAYTPDDRPRGGGVELLSRLDCDLLARAFAEFHGVVTIRLLHPAVWDTADSLTLRILSKAVHLRLEYVTWDGVVLLYAELPLRNAKS